MKKYYETLRVSEDATLEEVSKAFKVITEEAHTDYMDGKIDMHESARRYDEAEIAMRAIFEHKQKKAAEYVAAVETKEPKKEEPKKEEPKVSAVVVPVVEPKKEEPKKEEPKKEEPVKAKETVSYVKTDTTEQKTGAKKSGTGWKIATFVLAGLLLVGSLKCCHDKGCFNKGTGADVTGRPAITETLEDPSKATEEEQQTEAPTSETPDSKETETQEDYSDKEYIVDLGSVQDETLVRARATELVDQLNAAGIVCPRTTLPYDVDQVVQLIQFINGVYIPDTQEEIDILYFDALDLSTAQMNTQYYMDHINYAMGMDDVLGRINAETNVTHVTFGEAFVGYNSNGTYPLVQWMEQKRIQAYSTTDREEKNRIMYEVFQVLADLMKGNGCTITIYDGKEAKEGIEYTFTADQVLANPATAFFIMGEAKQVLMNCEYVDQTWTVYNRNNTDGVDQNGQPILVPDTVSQMEIEMYYNNGCYDSYQQAIDENYADGKTFAQITQMKIEAEALNNFEMGHNGKSLGK